MGQLLDKEQLELCRLLSLALHGRKLPQLDENVDYERVICIAQSHKVTSLLHPVLENRGLPANVWSIVDRQGEQAGPAKLPAFNAQPLCGSAAERSCD